MRKGKVFIAALLAASMSLIGTVSAFAENKGVEANTNVNGANVYFDKYLIMKKQANVPNATFTFTLSHDESLAHDATATAPQVYEGVGSPTVGNAVFAPTDATFDSAQAFVNGSTVQSKNTPAKDQVALAENEKYARQRVLVNFSGVTFTKPGIYRYKVTETDPTEIQGMDQIDPSVDSNQLFLDVYVNSDDAGVLSISGTVLHRENNVSAPSIDVESEYDGGYGDDPTQTKLTGFTNHYQTQDISLAKTVTGNQGDRSRYFEFTVNIKNAIRGSVFDVDLSNAEASVTVDGEAKQNPAKLTADDAGAVTATFYLKSTQSVKIQGLAENTTYAYTENISDAEGYQVSHVTNTRVDGQEIVAGTSATGKEVADTRISNMDQDTTFTNYRNGVVPTGLFMNIAPYIAIALLLAAAFVGKVLMKRKQFAAE